MIETSQIEIIVNLTSEPMKQIIFLFALLFLSGIGTSLVAQHQDVYTNQTDNYATHGLDIPQPPSGKANPWLDLEVDPTVDEEGNPWIDAAGSTNPALYFILKAYHLLRNSTIIEGGLSPKTSLPTPRRATFYKTIE